MPNEVLRVRRFAVIGDIRAAQVEIHAVVSRSQVDHRGELTVAGEAAGVPARRELLPR